MANGKKLNQLNWKKIGFEGATAMIGGPGGKIAKLAVKGVTKLAAAAAATKAGAKVASIARIVKSVKIKEIGRLSVGKKGDKGFWGVKWTYIKNGQPTMRSFEFHNGKHNHYYKGRNYRYHWQYNKWNIRSNTFNTKGSKHWSLFGRRLF